MLCAFFTAIQSGYKTLSYWILKVWLSSNLCWMYLSRWIRNTTAAGPLPPLNLQTCRWQMLCKAGLCWQVGSWERQLPQCTPKSSCSQKIQMLARQGDGWQSSIRISSAFKRLTQNPLRSLQRPITFENWNVWLQKHIMVATSVVSVMLGTSCGD